VPTPIATAQTSTAALVSLIFGIASYLVLPFIGGIVAIIAGHMARKEIREAQGRLSGDGMALAGLILGYAHFALFCVAMVIVVAVLGLIGGAAAQH